MEIDKVADLVVKMKVDNWQGGLRGCRPQTTWLTYPTDLPLQPPPIIITFRPDQTGTDQDRPGQLAYLEIRQFRHFCDVFVQIPAEYFVLTILPSQLFLWQILGVVPRTQQTNRREGGKFLSCLKGVFTLSCMNLVLRLNLLQRLPLDMFWQYINAHNNGTNMDPAWIDNCGKGKMNKKLVNPL